MPLIVTGLEADLRIIVEESAAFVVEIGAALLQALQTGTPVLTGHARNNWIPEIGSGSDRVVGSPASPGSPQSDAPIRGWKPGSGVVTIHNAVEYITFLDQGSSVQAPQGIVDPAIAAVEGRFRSVT